MSESNVIVISSDEDSNSVKVPKENELISDTDGAQSSNVKVQNNETDEIGFMNLTNSSVNKIFKKETENDKHIKQSNHSSSAAINTKSISDNIGVLENTIYHHESDAFKKFMNTVLSVEHDEENKTKLIKKLSKYHKLAHPNYIKSPEFIQLLERGIEKINKNSVYLYFVLKEVKDCLISNRVDFKFKRNTKDKLLSSGETATVKTCEEKNLATDANEYEKNYEIVKKLTSLLSKLEKKIKELEEMEVDFSDEEDSSYFKMQRYRERYCQVYKKLCTYTNRPLNANRIGASRRINFSDTDNLELNRAIEKWLNKTKQFPDYSDVYKLINELNESLNLNLNKDQTKTKALQIFEKIGNMLQRRRHFDLWDSLSSFLDTDIDPAVKNPELDSLLQKNFELGVKKEKELLRYYVEKQEREKLQPREVPDEEANCSLTESGDEDEKEIENIENMLDSKISEDDDDDDDESEDKSDESEIGDGSVCPSYSKTVEKHSSRMHVNAETRVKSKDYQWNLASNDNHVGSKCKASYVGIDSIKSETVGTNSATISLKDENVVGIIPNKQYIQDNPVFSKSKSLIKRKNETITENANDNANENESTNEHSFKRFPEDKETRREAKTFKKTKLINKSDSDSDCEIVEIISDKKPKTSNTPSLERKVYQINYAFINSNFNHNTVLSNNISRKRHFFRSNYKTMKNQQPHYPLPLMDLTNIKSIANKFARYKENKTKKKWRNMFNKPKLLSSINCQPLKGSNLKYDDLRISLAKNSISCALQQETKAENMKSQKEADKVNEKNGYQKRSSDESARSPNNGSSGGGNGQDNSENNGNKKPFDQEKQTEDNQENDDKEESEEEAVDGSENKLRETSAVIDAAPKLLCTKTETHQNEQNGSNAAHFNLISTEKTFPNDKRTAGKHLEKTFGIEISKERETLNSTPAARTSTTRTHLTRKRKVNENGGVQGTSQQGNINISTAKKVSTDPIKQEVNKVIPNTTASTDDDIEIIQVTKKKRSTPVKAVQSDEEIVKNFLQRSHPSISITTPKKKAVQKEPSPSVLQALETLSRLKGISTTIVKGSSKYNTDEDVTVIGESLNTRVNQISKLYKTPKSSTTTTTDADSTIPKIVTVQGNVSGFENITNDGTAIVQNFYPVCVQNPHANLANISGNATNYEENFTGANESIQVPRFHGVRSRSRHTPKTKSKNVEYVILD